MDSQFSRLRLGAAQLRRTRKATLPAFRIAWYGNPMIFHPKCQGPMHKFEGSLAVNDDGTCQLTLTNRAAVERRRDPGAQF